MDVADSFSITILTQDDVAEYRSIRLEALAKEPSAFASRTDDWIGLAPKKWRQKLSNPVFVARFEGEPVAMMGLSPMRPSKMSHRANLVGVYVRERFRGRGVGSLLFTAIGSFARKAGVSQLELTVSALNTPAICFYNRHGFKPVGRIPNALLDHGSAIDLLMMVCQLP